VKIPHLDILELLLDRDSISGSPPQLIMRKLFVHQEFKFIKADALG